MSIPNASMRCCGFLLWSFLFATGCGDDDSAPATADVASTADASEADAGDFTDTPNSDTRDPDDTRGLDAQADLGADGPTDAPSDAEADAPADMPSDAPDDARVDAEADALIDTDNPDAPDDAEERTPIIVGIEYVSIEGMTQQAAVAEALDGSGLTAVKPLPGNFEWGKMVRAPGATPNTIELDAFVTTWQARGYAHIMLGLRSHCSWGSIDWGLLGGTNPAASPDHMNDYRDWVRFLVERYDMDGEEDMPGLRYPIRHFEIGVEFSSYEPEPVEDYLPMLEAAHTVAHEASSEVQIAHAAFFIPNGFRDDPPNGISYAEAFAAARIAVPGGNIRGGVRTLEDMRAILAASDHFDVLNIHSLGDPTEIEGMMAWLEFETETLPNYPKPVVISDTTTEPFATLGPATVCDALPHMMSVLIHPSQEEDRCRLAEYFGRLVDGDEATVRWVQAFTARDLVRRTIIAAEQGVHWINLWSTLDVPVLTHPNLRAGAGNTAWAGLVDLEEGGAGERRAGFYAVAQLIAHMDGYTHIRRLASDNPLVRLYVLTGPWGERYVGWLERTRIVLPGDEIPTAMALLPLPGAAQVAETIGAFGQEEPVWTRVEPVDGVVTLTLTPTPIFIQPTP